MAEEDETDYRRLITEILQKHGFGWVVVQADVQISEGKPSSKQVSERETLPPAADPMFVVKRPRARRASLVTSEPYSETERLDILLKAIEAAVVQRALIEREVFDQLDVASIRFEPDSLIEALDSSLGVPHQLDRGQVYSSDELGGQMMDALTGMREREHDS